METDWTNDEILAARDKTVRDPAGNEYRVKLYSDGWAIDGHERMDIWTARRLLNDRGAIVI